MGNEKIKVIFIGGTGRNGSTLLDRILGQINGFFSLGEVFHIWERGLLENRRCGCGQPFKKCEFWQAVIREAFGKLDKSDLENILKLHRSVNRVRYSLWLIHPELRPRSYQAKLREYIDLWQQLYKAIYKLTSGKVLIDSSKLPNHGFILKEVQNVDLYMIHLVRDSRAVAFSWQRRKPRLDDPYGKDLYLPKLSCLRSSRDWMIVNVLLRKLSKLIPHSTFLRYEDLVTHPQETLTKVLSDLDLKFVQLDSWFKGKMIYLGDNHMIQGNPMRFVRGEIKIQLDDEWKRRMSFGKKVIVTAFTWPLLLKYGYK